jgi:hypothetical protein
MGQVLSFRNAQEKKIREGAPFLLNSFGSFRKDPLDVLWMKENAELLNVLETTGCTLNEGALEPLLPFYEGSLRHLNFFRQYYRFILSICLDLEDLGVPGQRAEIMSDWIMRQDVSAAELSDLQRAEARRLLARRGFELPDVEGLDDRLRAFMQRSGGFAVPNRKAAYELTHIVFYLTEYGRAPLELEETERQSLLFAGLIAFLDQDADLLAEICIALRFCNEAPPQEWSRWLEQHTGKFTLRAAPGRVRQDDYHPYLMCNWFQLLVGRTGFSEAQCEGSVVIEGPGRPGALRGMSMALYTLLDQAPGTWARVRAPLLQSLSSEEGEVLRRAEESTPLFEPFFETFSRFGQVSSA